MQFSNNWFDGMRPTWQLLFDHYKPTRYLEIGSFEGASACFAIEHIGKRGKGTVRCVDPWEDDNWATSEHNMDDAFEAFTRNTRMAALPYKDIHLNPMRGRSSVVLPQLVDSPYDVIYVDGSHLACDVMFDAVMAFQLLRVGGLLIFDDYLWRPDNNPAHAPRLAIDAFTAAYAEKMAVLRGLPLYQMYMQKVSD